MVNSVLDHQAAAVIILTVQAVDKHAAGNIDEQIAKGMIYKFISQNLLFTS